MTDRGPITEQGTALVVGGSGDIGRALAVKLAATGRSVVVSGRDASRLDDTCAAILAAGAAGAEALSLTCELTDDDAVAELVARADAWRKPLDVVVNAAGVAPTDMFLRSDRSSWEQALATNLMAAQCLSRAALDCMRRRRRGLIVHIGSLAAHRAQPGLAPYAASKAALHSLADSLRLESERFGIAVAVIAPDRVSTRMHSDADRAEAAMLQPQDVAEALGLLLSLSPEARIDEIVLRAQARRGAAAS